jgi:hypothetical protein
MASDPTAQKKVVHGLLERNKLAKGQTWYPIEFRWWKGWKEYVGYDAKEATSPARAGPRPIPAKK